MKAWEVLAVAHDGELVCPDCYTEEEQAVADGKDGTDEEITPLFASDVEQEETCGRCLQVIEGTEGCGKSDEPEEADDGNDDRDA